MLKKLLINLERRPERLAKHDFDFKRVDAIDGTKLTQEQIKHANMRPNWRDPFRNRRMTKGEYGCFMSHVHCWEIVAAQDDPVLILEDDAVFTDHYDEAALKKKLEESDADVILLGYNENIPERRVHHGDGFVTPGFPYNTHACLVSPRSARKLLELTRRKDFSIIPLDNWFSEQLHEGNLNLVACETDMATQMSRSEVGHDIEPSVSSWFDNYTVHALSCGTDTHKMFRLDVSSAAHGFYYTNIGAGREWRGTEMSGPGGGQKVNLLKEYLQYLPDTDIVLFVDGYDVFFTDTLDQIIHRWHEFGTRILFGAEKICWPDTSIAPLFPDQPTEYKYLNSGTLIGEVGELKRFLDGKIEDHEDDQLFMQERFLTGNFDVQLDSEQYIFQVYDECVQKVNRQIYNPETRAYGCLFHGNGGDQAKIKLDNLYNQFYNNSYIRTVQEPKLLSKDMLELPFVTEDWCNRVIELAEKHGGWEPLPEDLFPAQEIRLKEVDKQVYDDFCASWNELMVPAAEKYWFPLKMYGIRDVFVMKYTKDTQNKLALHHDASLVTGSIKLNEAYEGGSLNFPRQGVTNDNTPIGHCILFPGQVTHGHECVELTSGVKYSLTIWTSRYEGDVL